MDFFLVCFRYPFTPPSPKCASRTRSTWLPHHTSHPQCKRFTKGDMFHTKHALEITHHLLCRAVDADVLILNEIGLDPGIDHCSAFALLDSLRREGKRVVSFTSFCGGLPAPDCAADVPLKYKFSWSPRGVLSAALNGAKFLLDGKVRETVLSLSP